MQNPFRPTKMAVAAIASVMVAASKDPAFKLGVMDDMHRIHARDMASRAQGAKKELRKNSRGGK